ncbi:MULTISPECIES: hypothetical protein [Streptomyces]|uniref:PknH-like extracellular domain-containing protein n=1 Tax=Streptomyces griseosporeus TaxID=1910 RepID=A0ABV3KYV6_STRGS|nr:hypothetical protein [Streptomyces actuosus]MBM4821173.1 hypothetical protein [Streptomyces actuosus]
MTTPPPPPPGPPRGPLSGMPPGRPPAQPPGRPPAQPPAEPPPPGRRPWWRRGSVLVGVAAVVAVAAAAAVAVVVLRGRGDDGLAGVDTPAEARKLAARVALKPSDWGAGFRPGSPYEADGVVPQVADDDCGIAAGPDDDVLAALLRDSQREYSGTGETVFARSVVFVLKSARSAEANIARRQSDTQRCRTLYSGKQRWQDVHEVKMATPEGFDEMTVEEGRLAVDATGRSVDEPYTQATGRKGQLVLRTSVIGSPQQNRSAAVAALSRMLDRV